MAKANGSLYHDNFAINVLAKRAAIEAVKAKLRSQGVKVTLVRCAELHRLARQHLEDNEAQLFAQAKQKWSLINGHRADDGLDRGQAVPSPTCEPFTIPNICTIAK
jgi:hypothetical protein